MNINLNSYLDIGEIMKVTLTQLLAIVLFASLVQASDIKAQAILNKTVSLNISNTSLSTVLTQIEKQTAVKFVYSKEFIKSDKLVSIKTTNKHLSKVLNELFRPLDITYEVVNGQISLRRKRPLAATSEVTDPINIQTPAAVDFTVTGQVTAPNGDALPGVTVVVKGTSTGTTTNPDGSYTLSVNDGNNILVFSFIGFVTKEVEIKNQATLNVTLAEDSKSLNEVVVVAYGIQKKATLTGAVAAINTKEIKQSPAANLAVTLTGRLPGLFAQQTSGEPGRDATLLFMRGRGTLNGSSPLILVDGVERELTSIDPNEVETVSILKDASSTALFGVRGANGVILVTTKRGTEITPSIGLSIETGVQSFTRRPSSLDSYEWAQLKNQAWKNDFPKPAANNFAPYSDYALERYRLQDDPEVYSNNDWADILMKKWVPQTRYNLNLNGKGANVAYFVNVGFLNQSGQWNIDPSVTEYNPSQFMKRYNFRSNIDATLNKPGTLKTFLNASGSFESVNGPFVDARYNNTTATGEIINRILNTWPSVQPGPLTPGGEILVGGGNYGESPWGYINRTGYRKESRSNITASWGLEQDFSFLTKGLSSKVMLSFDTRSIHNLNASRQYQFWVQVIDPNSKTPDGKDLVTYQRTRTDFDNTPLNTSISASFQSFYDIQFHTNYNRTFAEKHTITGLILAQQQSLIKPSDALPFNVRGLATRLNYSYDDRYIAEFNAGYNGSEQFAKGRRYGFFPSFSGGWNVHNESFLKDYANTVHLLKLRGSYGTVGGDQLGSRRFLYLDEISRGGGSYSGTLGRGANINESFFGNPNIQWEVAKKTNLGLEFGLFNQFTLTTDFFKERRDNVLIYRGSIPLLIGVPASTLAPSNIGIIENKGYEIALDYSKVFHQNFSILSKLNFNYANNKILFNDEVLLDEGYAYRYRSTGYQIGQQWGYNSLGFFNSQEEIDAYGVTYQGRASRPGDLKFEDLNGDKVINDKDVMPIGGSNVPLYNWGAAGNVIFKNFDLSVLFQGAFKVSAQLIPSEINDFIQRHRYAWTPERAAAGAEILYPALSLSQSASANNNSYFNENKSFVRLKNVEVGYFLPATLTNKVGIKSLRVYLNGLNLITWDKLAQKDWDPELSGPNSFPVYRVVNAGVNVKF
ncbi:MAG: TonB-linked outer membrane protein SusC/RagA family [Adhaeribacter sp.]|nr:TonB-linked outer membrane protein SusC/RagA family [Adhaeribacter sp.]